LSMVSRNNFVCMGLARLPVFISMFFFNFHPYLWKKVLII
jgi:hypothetical protein